MRRATASQLKPPVKPHNFYPRSPCGERHQILDDTSGATEHFYPRSPCGERLWPGLLARPFFIISIHALLAESDLLRRNASCSCRSISIHALLAESDAIVSLPSGLTTISIHALLAESDTSVMKQKIRELEISIHALLAESDILLFMKSFASAQFLSTLSLRRATHSLQVVEVGHTYFYPRSPCGERQLRFHTIKMLREFLSTLSLRRATLAAELTVALLVFLSTLSLRRATQNAKAAVSMPYNFYPRSPCGERHNTYRNKQDADKFLSTLSLRRATSGHGLHLYYLLISIHALLAESDFLLTKHTI